MAGRGAAQCRRASCRTSTPSSPPSPSRGCRGRPESRTGRTRRAGCRRSSRGRCARRSCPISGPPQIWRSAALSMIQFIARRTWMSSNGGWVRFIVRYSTRSAGLRWRYCLFDGSVEYRSSACGGRLGAFSSSSSPAPTRSTMSVTFGSTVNAELVGEALRARPASPSSGRSRGCGRASRIVCPSNPLIGFSFEHDEASTLSAPSIM